MADWHIVGRGPSLLDLTPDDFGPGPVITLNQSIDQVRALDLPSPIFSMFKDGCGIGLPHGTLLGPGHDCALAPEGTLVLSHMESRHCRPAWAPRIVLDVEEMGLPWFYQSAPVAVAFAIARGAGRIRMFGFDVLRGDTRRVVGSELIDDGDTGYMEAAKRAIAVAGRAGVELVW
jgi:hypothetical protein